MPTDENCFMYIKIQDTIPSLYAHVQYLINMMSGKA